MEENRDQSDSAGGTNHQAGGEGDKGNTVSREAYEKLIAQRKKDREILESLQQFKSQVEKEKEETERKLLEEKGEYKKILESREKELQEERQRRLELENNLVKSMKLGAVLKKLPGRLANDSYSSFIEVDSIAIDPETGKIDENTVSEVANKFLKEHSTLIKTSGNKSTLPTDEAKTAKSITYEEWLKLPSKEMDAKRHLVK